MRKKAAIFVVYDGGFGCGIELCRAVPWFSLGRAAVVGDVGLYSGGGFVVAELDLGQCFESLDALCGTKDVNGFMYMLLGVVLGVFRRPSDILRPQSDRAIMVCGHECGQCGQMDQSD